MIKALSVLVVLAALGIGATFTPIRHIADSFFDTSAHTVFGANGPTCNFSGATAAGTNGFTAVTLSWTVTNATKIMIGNGTNGSTPVVGATTTQNASSVAFIKVPTTYLLIAGDGSSTSTCSFTASP